MGGKLLCNCFLFSVLLLNMVVRQPLLLFLHPLFVWHIHYTYSTFMCTFGDPAFIAKMFQFVTSRIRSDSMAPFIPLW